MMRRHNGVIVIKDGRKRTVYRPRKGAHPLSDRAASAKAVELTPEQWKKIHHDAHQKMVADGKGLFPLPPPVEEPGL